jgi:hypothetical protein
MVTEHLDHEGRQASVVVLRESHPDTVLPQGCPTVRRSTHGSKGIRVVVVVLEVLVVDAYSTDATQRH